MPFEWTEKDERSFQELKTYAAENIRTRGFFDNERTTVVYTDASENGLGAILAQRYEENGLIRETTIACAAKTLTTPERKYPQTQREALAIVWAVERFSHYLLGRKFVIVTDHKPLAFIFERCKITEKRPLTRAEAWALKLANYSYSIEVIRSEENIADAPSRLYTEDDEPYEEEMEGFGLFTVELKFEDFKYNTSRARISWKQVAAVSADDDVTQGIALALVTDDWNDERLRKFEKVKGELNFVDGVLIR